MGRGRLAPPRAEPDAVLQDIRRHLGELRYRTAQELARKAAQQFPDQPAIASMNRALNKPLVVRSPGKEPSSREELNWLRNPPKSVHGKWVALLGRELVTVADTLAEVMSTVDSMNLPRKPLVHRID